MQNTTYQTVALGDLLAPNPYPGRGIVIGKTPDAIGSRVPQCPILRIFNRYRSFEMQLCEVIPLGLSIMIIPSIPFTPVWE